jgi:AmiR/NasT family two-component response regulator
VSLSRERAQVHQATGMLISGLGVPAEQALAKLRAHAFAVGRMVDEIADDLVSGRLVPADIEP